MADARLLATTPRTPLPGLRRCRSQPTTKLDPSRPSRRSRTECSGKGPSCGVALKEWAAIIAALGSGDQTVIFRKGGIREASFRAREVEFLLFPNSFHSEGALLKPDAAARFAKELTYEPKEQEHVRIDYAATITGAWTTMSPCALQALDAHHVLGPEFLDRRLNWRAKSPVNILELRCQRLRQPLLLPQAEFFYGCFSWVDLPGDLVAQALGAADPVMPEPDFKDRQEGLRAALEHIEAQPVL